VVHNGSTLFSGDAGSGESAIRKHFFDNDWVEAIIQMPTDEFFNTGIYTYLWVFNKNKAAERKDKVILINAADLFVPLKKSKGKKRKEMSLDNRTEIVKAFTTFKDLDTEQGRSIAKVFDKWHFYYNKQSIMLTNVDEFGNAIEMPNKVSKDGEVKEEKSIKLDVKSILVVDSFKENGMKAINTTEITEFDKTTYSSLSDYFDKHYKAFVNSIDYKDEAFVLFDNQGNSFTYNNNKETIVVKDKNQKESFLGNGKIVIKSSYKKATKTKAQHILVTAELTKDLQKDYEIIPFHPIEETNKKNIADFMAKYITKPFEYLDNTIGVEINFNKVFYKPEQLRDIIEITADLMELESELAHLQKELAI